jgi:hypothetical protein
LTPEQATRALATYGGVPTNATASFPKAVSTSPVLLDSMGPTQVSEDCYRGWRKAFQSLTEQGYLSSFWEIDNRLAVETIHLTPKGDLFFHPLMPGSIYWLVKLVSGPFDRGLEVLQITRGKRKTRAVVMFRCTLFEPFLVMWENRLFTPECRGELSNGVTIHEAKAVGHAHLCFREGEWRVERVVLGSLNPEE